MGPHLARLGAAVSGRRVTEGSPEGPAELSSWSAYGSGRLASLKNLAQEGSSETETDVARFAPSCFVVSPSPCDAYRAEELPQPRDDSCVQSQMHLVETAG